MTRLALLPLVSLSAALPLAAPELSFTPHEGTELTITAERELDVELVSDEMTLDGAPHAGAPVPEITIAVDTELELVDRWETVADGRVTRLVRTFEELTEERAESYIEHAGDGDDRTLEAESDLEGLTVVFTWDDDDEAFAAEHEEDGDPDLLEGLVADLSLRSFLPDEDVVEGDDWEVPAPALNAVFAPGGDLKLQFDPESALPDLPADAELEGDVRATLGALRDEDGLEVRAIALEVEVGAETELDDEVQESLTVEYELEGELLWLEEEGRFHSLDLSGDVTWTVIQLRTVTMGDRDFETERTIEFAGDAEYSLQAE